MLRHCCCIVNVTLFSHVTLIRKLQLTSDLDHFHASDLPCSLVKSHDDPISDCLVDRQLPVPLYIYRLQQEYFCVDGECICMS